MIAARWIAWAVVALGIGIGAVSDTVPQRAPVELGGYRVLTGDFHLHSAPLSGSSIGPWDIVLEARRQGLDVIAITPHNGVLAGRMGRWFAERVGGPIVIPGEELHGPNYHLLALGASYLSWRLDASDAIDAVHREGGVAIAAHPVVRYWPAYEGATARRLDGAEVMQPIINSRPEFAHQLREFLERSGAAAIGSSDWHGMGPIGRYRTHLFVREASANGVMEAIRARRTVVMDGERPHGDPALVGFAPQLPRAPARPSPVGAACVLAGLATLIFFRAN
jgi:hypothetical protein